MKQFVKLLLMSVLLLSGDMAGYAQRKGQAKIDSLLLALLT